MPVVIALLKGVNVGGNCMIPMATLRSVCNGLGHEGTVTYIQSGNAVFRTKKRDMAKVASELEAAIHAQCGFRPAVALRTVSELAAVIRNNPFAGRPDLQLSRLLVTFLVKDPGDDGRIRVRAIDVVPEELHAVGSELYTCYLDGVGKTKINFKAIERAIGCAGTARNWNTVLKLMEMAKALESA